MVVERKSLAVTFWVILLAVGLLSILPFAWVVFGSLKPDTEILAGRVWPWQEILAAKAQDAATTAPAQGTGSYLTLRNYKTISGRLSGLDVYYFNTIYLSIAGTFMAVLIGSFAAYGFARFKFPGNRILFGILLLTIMIPGEVTLIGRFELMFQLGLYNKVMGLLLSYLGGGLILIVFIMRNVFQSIPQDLVDAAMIDGASSWQVFWEVMVPLGRNGLAACAIITFLNIWNEFMTALSFTSLEKARTLAVGITLLKNQWGGVDNGLLFATVLLSFLPIIIVFVLLQKYFVRGLSTGALKG